MQKKFIQQANRLFTFLFLSVLCCCVRGSAYAQDDGLPRVTIHLVKAPMSQAMKDIERQTKYLFITGPDVNTDHNVTIDVSSASLRVALDQMLRGTDIAYEIRSLGILLSRRPATDATPARITGVVVDAQGKPRSMP